MTSNETATIPAQYNSSGEYLKSLEDSAALEILPTLGVLAVLSVVGVVGNLLTLYVYFTRFHPSSTRTYILAMSIFDMLFCAISLPGDIMDLRFPLTYNASWLCRLHKFITIFFTLASGFILVVVAIVRRRKVCHPFRTQLNAANVNRSVVLCILVAAAFSAPFGVLNGHHSVATDVPGVVGVACSVDDAFLATVFPIAYNLLLAVVFVASCVVMVTSYVQIAHKIVRHKRRSVNGGLLTGIAMALKAGGNGLRESSSSRRTTSSSKDQAGTSGSPQRRGNEGGLASKGEDTSHIEEQSHYDEEFHEEVLQGSGDTLQEKRRSSHSKKDRDSCRKKDAKVDVELVEKARLMEIVVEKDKLGTREERENGDLQQELNRALGNRRTSTNVYCSNNKIIKFDEESIIKRGTSQNGTQPWTETNKKEKKDNNEAWKDDDDVFIAPTTPTDRPPACGVTSATKTCARMQKRSWTGSLQNGNRVKPQTRVRSSSLRRKEEELDVAIKTLVHAVSDDPLKCKADSSRQSHQRTVPPRNLTRRSLSAGDNATGGKPRSASLGDEFFHLSVISDFIKGQDGGSGPVTDRSDVTDTPASPSAPGATEKSREPASGLAETECAGGIPTLPSQHETADRGRRDGAAAAGAKENGDVTEPTSSTAHPKREEKAAPETNHAVRDQAAAEDKDAKRMPATSTKTHSVLNSHEDESEAAGADQTARKYSRPTQITRPVSPKSYPNTTQAEAASPQCSAANPSRSDDVASYHSKRMYSSASLSSRSDRLQSFVQRSLRRFRSAAGSEGDDAGVTSSLRRRHSRKKIPSRTTWMMFVLAAIFVISYLPYLTINGVRAAVHDIESGLRGWRLNLYTLALKCYFINAVVNPIVYSFCSARFRHQCRNICLCKTKKPMST